MQQIYCFFIYIILICAVTFLFLLLVLPMVTNNCQAFFS